MAQRHPIRVPEAPQPKQGPAVAGAPPTTRIKEGLVERQIRQFPPPHLPLRPSQAIRMVSKEDLFAFAKVPLGDFEGCMAWVESHRSIDYAAYEYEMKWQTIKTFERLLKRDFDVDRQLRVVQDFANQCVQQYALLNYGKDCGYERLRRYLHDLILTSEMYRMDYLSRMISLSPPSRLEYITRPVPGQLEKLRWFCLLYDHLYEKLEQEARHNLEKTIFDKFQTRLESVQARLSRGASTALGSPVAENVGRAI